MRMSWSSVWMMFDARAEVYEQRHAQSGGGGNEVRWADQADIDGWI